MYHDTLLLLEKLLFFLFFVLLKGGVFICFISISARRHQSLWFLEISLVWFFVCLQSCTVIMLLACFAGDCTV